MAVYQWLDDMKTQFHYIDDEGAFAELDVEQEKGSYVTCRQANNTYFLSVPQVLRRCFFLSVNEKAVLWELMSWLDDIGYSRVSLKTLSLYTGISEKTVSKMLNGLVDKGIIRRRHTSSTDMFMVCDLSKNPYVLLSEGIHYWIKTFIRRCLPEGNRARKIENLFAFDVPMSLNLARKAVNTFIRNPRTYGHFIKKLKQEGSFKGQYEETMNEVIKMLGDYYEEESQKLA